MSTVCYNATEILDFYTITIIFINVYFYSNLMFSIVSLTLKHILYSFKVLTLKTKCHQLPYKTMTLHLTLVMIMTPVELITESERRANAWKGC